MNYEEYILNKEEWKRKQEEERMRKEEELRKQIEEEEKGFVLTRLVELENHSFESSDFIDLAYNKHFDEKIGPTLVLKGGKSYGKQCKN